MGKCDVPNGMCKDCAHKRYNKKERQLLDIIERTSAEIEVENPLVELTYNLGAGKGIESIICGYLIVGVECLSFATIEERNKYVVDITYKFIDIVNEKARKKFGFGGDLMPKSTFDGVREL